MRLRFWLLLVCILWGSGMTGCAEPESSPVEPGEVPNIKLAHVDAERIAAPNVPQGNREVLVEGNTTFAFDLYQKIREEDGNLIASPYSISLALAMTYAGARGETEQQMANTLHFDLPQEHLHPAFNALDLDLTSRGDRKAEGEEEGQVLKLHIVNALWGQEGENFREAFLETLAVNYGASLRLLDFAGRPEGSRQVINDWVAEETEDRIKDIIPPGAITPDTSLVLSNAIGFTASWMYPFEDSLTEKKPFTLLDGSEVSVPMMHQQHEFGYTSGDGYEVAALPYYGGDGEMILIVPGKGRFAEVESRLDAAMFSEIAGSLEAAEIALTMPRFEFEANTDLSDTLAEMGMPAAFGGGADFSGMADFFLFISDVLHKAFIKVDESGTEAAAATVVIMMKGAMVSDEPLAMTLDRPFIFTIYDRTSGTVLFVGRVVNPSE